jgi:hypothetical protein
VAQDSPAHVGADTERPTDGVRARHYGLMGQMPWLREWADLVDQYFHFLRDRGFTLVEVADEPHPAAWGPRVRYVGERIGVQVHWSGEFVCVDTYVIRLDNGRVPEYPIFIHDGDPISWFHLGMILDTVSPERYEQARALTGLEPDSVARQLAFAANTFSDLADDLLDPDSDAFARVTARIHDQARADPPKITIFSPEDASDQDVARVVAKSRSAFPRVGVIVRRYFTRRRRT